MINFIYICISQTVITKIKLIMTIDETNLLSKKAEFKKDGVYSYMGYKYAVKNNRFIAFADHQGNILHRQGSFNLVAGKVESYERINALKQIIKSN